MNVEIFTMWYNEEVLAPLFLDHYSYVDKITVLLDQDTTDSTPQILKKYSNVAIIDFKFPDMMDDHIKINRLTEEFHKSTADWVYLLDADEFIWTEPLGSDPKNCLNRADGNVVVARMFQVFRHRTDSDIDYSKPALLQRRHGDPNRETGINQMYNKPIIFKPEIKPRFSEGNHAMYCDSMKVASNLFFEGAHWAMADYFAIQRRVTGRKNRQSNFNIVNRLTYHNHNITEESVLKEIEDHLDCPLLF